MKFITVALLALITHLCVVYGLVMLLPVWLAPLMAGGIAALASRAGWKHAVSGALLGLTIVVLLARPWLGGGSGAPSTTAESMIFIALGALAAGLTAMALRMAADRQKAEWWAAIGAVAVIVVLMWTTAAASNRGEFIPEEPSLNHWLSAPPALGATPGDRDYFLRVFYDMHDGVPYYEAYIRVYRNDPIGEFRLPNGVPGYRLPTLFYLWLLLPADGTAIPWLFLVFATLAVGSAFALGAQLGPPRLAVLGVLMVAPAYLTEYFPIQV